jgi:hypothetical protein
LLLYVVVGRYGIGLPAFMFEQTKAVLVVYLLGKSVFAHASLSTLLHRRSTYSLWRHWSLPFGQYPHRSETDLRNGAGDGGRCVCVEGGGGGASNDESRDVRYRLTLCVTRNSRQFRRSLQGRDGTGSVSADRRRCVAGACAQRRRKVHVRIRCVCLCMSVSVSISVCLCLGGIASRYGCAQNSDLL